MGVHGRTRGWGIVQQATGRSERPSTPVSCASQSLEGPPGPLFPSRKEHCLGPVPGLLRGAGDSQDTCEDKRSPSASTWNRPGRDPPRRSRGAKGKEGTGRVPVPGSPGRGGGAGPGPGSAPPPPHSPEARPRPSGSAVPPRRVARGSDVTARWRRLLQAAEGGFRPGRSKSIRGGERESGAGGGRSRDGGAQTVPSAPY